MKLTEEQLQRVLKDRTYWATIAARIIREAQAHAGSSGSWPSSQNQTVEEPLPRRVVVDSARARGSLPEGPLAQLVDQGRSTIPSRWQAESWKRQWQEGAKPPEQPLQRLIVKRSNATGNVLQENAGLQLARTREKLGILAKTEDERVLESFDPRERRRLLLAKRR